MIGVLPEEARELRCCVMDKFCEADGCMAWTWELTVGEVGKQGTPYPMPSVRERSGKGYCGMCMRKTVYHVHNFSQEAVKKRGACA